MKGFVFKFLLPVAVILGGVYYGVQRITPQAYVVQPVRGVAPKVVSGNVRVLAEKRSDLKSDEGGRIAESFLELGKKVSEGDVLIRLDDSEVNLMIEATNLDLEAAIEIAGQESEAARSLAAHKQLLEAAKLDFERGFKSEADIENLQIALKAREDALARDTNTKARDISKLENALKRLELKRNRMTLKSPITGIVYEIRSYEGDLIGSGQTIANIASTATLVEARVSEESFSDLAVGQIARVKFLGFGDESFDATIEKLVPVAHEAEQRYSIFLDVEIDAGRLTPGLTGETSITVDERENALLIPKKAVNGNSVMVVESGRAVIRNLKLGYGSLTYVEVLEGLDEDDLVIVENLSSFRDGQRVRAVMAKSI